MARKIRGSQRVLTSHLITLPWCKKWLWVRNATRTQHIIDGTSFLLGTLRSSSQPKLVGKKLLKNTSSGGKTDLLLTVSVYTNHILEGYCRCYISSESSKADILSMRCKLALLNHLTTWLLTQDTAITIQNAKENPQESQLQCGNVRFGGSQGWGHVILEPEARAKGEEMGRRWHPEPV